MKWVKLTENKVVEILNNNPNGMYHPDFVKQCLEVSDNVGIGWERVNGSFKAPNNRLEYYERKLKEITSMRETTINGGVLYKDIMFDSDVKSRENISGAANSLALGWVVPDDFVWMSADNIQVPFNRDDIKGLALTMIGFISEVYAKSFKMKTELTALYNNEASQEVILAYEVKY